MYILYHLPSILFIWTSIVVSRPVADTTSAIYTSAVSSPTSSATDSSASLYPPAEPISPNPHITQKLIEQLELASTNVDRMTIIKNLGPEYIKFDFNVAANPDGGVSRGLGGQGDLANKKTFPVSPPPLLLLSSSLFHVHFYFRSSLILGFQDSQVILTDHFLNLKNGLVGVDQTWCRHVSWLPKPLRYEHTSYPPSRNRVSHNCRG